MHFFYHVSRLLKAKFELEKKFYATKSIINAIPNFSGKDPFFLKKSTIKCFAIKQ